jgi:hypothetical protein
VALLVRSDRILRVLVRVRVLGQGVVRTLVGTEREDRLLLGDFVLPLLPLLFSLVIHRDL